MLTPETAAANLAARIEHSLLKAEATRSDISRLCKEAVEHRFCAVCVNGTWVAEAREALEFSEVKVVVVVGFPLGAMEADVKRYECEAAVDEGAHEIDLVINIGRLKQGDHRFLLRELRDLVEAADERVVKVILEAPLLTREEKIAGCRIAEEAGAHFVKTSTGFNGNYATIEDVRLFRESVPTLKIKAAGGIRDRAAALAMVEAGADRIGTSRGVALVRD